MVVVCAGVKVCTGEAPDGGRWMPESSRWIVFYAFIVGFLATGEDTLRWNRMCSNTTTTS